MNPGGRRFAAATLQPSSGLHPRQHVCGMRISTPVSVWMAAWSTPAATLRCTSLSVCVSASPSVCGWLPGAPLMQLSTSAHPHYAHCLNLAFTPSSLPAAAAASSLATHPLCGRTFPSAATLWLLPLAWESLDLQSAMLPRCDQEGPSGNDRHQRVIDDSSFTSALSRRQERSPILMKCRHPHAGPQRPASLPWASCPLTSVRALHQPLSLNPQAHPLSSRCQEQSPSS